LTFTYDMEKDGNKNPLLHYTGYTSTSFSTYKNISPTS